MRMCSSFKFPSDTVSKNNSPFAQFVLAIDNALWWNSVLPVNVSVTNDPGFMFDCFQVGVKCCPGRARIVAVRTSEVALGFYFFTCRSTSLTLVEILSCNDVFQSGHYFNEMFVTRFLEINRILLSLNGCQLHKHKQFVSFK